MSFVISDPYPNTVIQPTEFEVKVDGGAPQPSVPAVDAAGNEFFHFDLTTIGDGKHTIEVSAKGSGGESAFSAPFTFELGVPPVPANLRLSDI
jgi:hypothetical protein